MELALSMVVISFLIVVVIGGDKLLENAKLQKVSAEFKKLEEAYLSFKEIYSGLPGDFEDASTFWNNDCDGGANGGTDICSGNGDGDIDTSGYNDWQEALKSTYHLKKAGLIDDNISKENDPVGTGRPGFVPGTNIPASTWPETGYSIWGVLVSNEGFHHAIFAGGTATESWNYSAKFTPAQARYLDRKMDDDMPQTGKLRGASLRGADQVGQDLKECTTCTEATADNCHNSKAYKYDVDVTTVECIPTLILETY